MTKKTRLIPFDYQKWKDDIGEPIRRNGDKVVFIGLDSDGLICVSLDKDHKYDFHRINTNGRFWNHSLCDMDLMLKEELEEKTFYVNVYPHGFSAQYGSLEAAKKDADSNYLGVLKITYTEEDLIK